MENVEVQDRNTETALQGAEMTEVQGETEGQEDIYSVIAAAVPPVVPETAEEKLHRLELQLQELLSRQAGISGSSIPKNQRPSRVTSGRKYVILSKTLRDFGKVPQQQRDIAALLTSNLSVGVEYTEEEVFRVLHENYVEYPSLGNSVQAPDYLFRYYRGLKNDGKHAGFIARGFIRQIG